MKIEDIEGIEDIDNVFNMEIFDNDINKYSLDMELPVFINHNKNGVTTNSVVDNEKELYETLRLSLTTTRNAMTGRHYINIEILKIDISHRYKIAQTYIHVSNNMRFNYVYKVGDGIDTIYYPSEVRIIMSDNSYYNWLQKMRENYINEILS
tara:strand:- start:5268 stop:5723 length:456 start_codon:yes stop_codon:yes gene_type:complete